MTDRRLRENFARAVFEKRPDMRELLGVYNKGVQTYIVARIDSYIHDVKLDVLLTREKANRLGEIDVTVEGLDARLRMNVYEEAISICGRVNEIYPAGEDVKELFDTETIYFGLVDNARSGDS